MELTTLRHMAIELPVVPPWVYSSCHLHDACHYLAQMKVLGVAPDDVCHGVATKLRDGQSRR